MIRYLKGVPDVDMVKAVRDIPGVAPLCGDDVMMLLALCHGAIGSTVGSANLQPATLAAIHRAVAAGDLPLARKIYARELLPAVNTCCLPKADYIRAYKEVLTVMGVLRTPFTRPPLTALDQIRREELLGIMANLSLI
jgi:dihydrodipicolinate synthase/N-acetylneuraminate lyase